MKRGSGRNEAQPDQGIPADARGWLAPAAEYPRRPLHTPSGRNASVRGGGCGGDARGAAGSASGPAAGCQPGRGAKGCLELPPHIVACTSGYQALLSHSKHGQPSWILLHPSLWYRARQLPVQLWTLKLDTVHYTSHHKPNPSSYGVLVQLSNFWYFASGIRKTTSTISNVGSTSRAEHKRILKTFKELLNFSHLDSSRAAHGHKSRSKKAVYMENTGSRHIPGFLHPFGAFG